MTNKLYRYELAYFGEIQGIGFITGLKDLGISDEFINHVDSLNTEWEVIEETIENYTTVYEDDLQALVLKKY